MKTTTDESQLLSDVYAEAQERFSMLNDLAHGWEHVQRVYRLALHIAQQEGAERVGAAGHGGQGRGAVLIEHV